MIRDQNSCLLFFQYDEVLPETMTTKLGGFYINSGKLDLVELSDSSEDEFRSPMVKKNKKRVSMRDCICLFQI